MKTLGLECRNTLGRGCNIVWRLHSLKINQCGSKICCTYIHDEHVQFPLHEQHVTRPFEYQTQSESETALHSGPPIDARPLTLDPKQLTYTGEPITTTLKQLVEVQTLQAELSALLTKQNITNHLPVNYRATNI